MSKKNTKRALLSSVLALVLCFAMLTGTTFAWFTDSVTSGKNQIVAGNLDVELEHTNEFVANDDVERDTNLFCDKDGNRILWEPGVVAWENLTVKNVGNLALKYQLAINFENENAIIDGTNLYKLSDVLKVAVVDPIAANTSREDVLKLAKQNGKSLASFVENGELKPGAEGTKTYGLVIFWEPGPNDNNWNKNNGKSTTDGEALHIDLGISLIATQMMHENDSFGKDYDEEAIYTDVTVSTNEEFLDALTNAKPGDTIGIKGNIEWETGAGHGSTPLPTNVNSLTLQGIGDDATFTATGAGVGTIRLPNGTLSFKDLTIVDNSQSYAEDSWEFGYLEMAGSLYFENCDFVNAIMIESEQNCLPTDATFVNCRFNSNNANEYDVWVCSGNVTFTDCVFEGYRGLKTHEDYGSEIGTVLVENCVFGPLSKKPGLAIGDVNADTTIILKNNTFADTQPGDGATDSAKGVPFIYETDTPVDTFNFVNEGSDVAKSVSVSDVNELSNALSGAGQAGAGNTVIKLGADMDLTGTNWTPINVDGYHGADVVTIDGQGHTITGLSAPLFAGGFAGGSGIVIKNLTIADSNIVSTSTQGSGAFIQCADSMDVITLVNCHVKNSTITGSRTGGLVGWTSGYSNVNDGPVKTYVTITNCSVTESVINGTGSVGGIIGHSGASAWTFTVIKDCTVKNCELNSTDEDGWRVGVVAGTVNIGEQNDFSNITESGNTLTQTGKTAPAGQSNLYGRFVPGTTGKLTIDGVEITN